MNAATERMTEVLRAWDWKFEVDEKSQMISTGCNGDNGQWRIRTGGLGERMRQTAFQQLDPAALAQEGPERGRARVRAESLVGKTDLDGLTRALELNIPGHRLVSRACA